MPIVLVELPDNDAAGANVPALISACSAGLRRGNCAVEEPRAEPAAAVAIVVWLDNEHLHARIEVGRRADERAGWQTRELAFQPQDDVAQRYRAVGLAIAGVVGETTLLEPERPPAPTGERTPLPPAIPSLPLSRRFRVALGSRLQTGLSITKPAAGAFVELGLRPSAQGPFELALGGAEALSVAQSSGISTHFTAFRVGASALLSPVEQVVLRGGAFVAVTGVNASATDPATSAHASGSRWLLAGSLRGQVAWPAKSWVSGVLGLEITRLSGATRVQNAARTEISPATFGGAELGLECKF